MKYLRSLSIRLIRHYAIQYMKARRDLYRLKGRDEGVADEVRKHAFGKAVVYEKAITQMEIESYLTP